MTRGTMIGVGVGLAAFVMIEIYNAAVGVLLVMWLLNQQQAKESGFQPQRIIIELTVEPTETGTQPAIGVALAIDGQAVNPEVRTNASTAVVVPPVLGQSRYRVLLPRDLGSGDRLIVHLYDRGIAGDGTCKVRWTITDPDRNDGTPREGPQPLTLSYARPAFELLLEGIHNTTWEPTWTPAE